MVRAATGAFTIADLTIGAGRCFVIAEAGVNHNGRVDLAHQLVDVAADAGADAVKFQTFDPAQLASPDAEKAAYQVRNTGSTESQLEMLAKLVLPADAYRELQSHATERNIMFLSTAFDEGSADFLNDLGMPAFKVPSGEVTNHLLLSHVAQLGKPILLSTGMSTEREVEAALGCIQRTADVPVALFHCVSNYPAPPEDCNLRAIESMRRRFDIPVGWSDHTTGTLVSVVAVAAGAELLEKHFTLHRSMPGPDHAASLEPAELTALVASVRTVEAAMGTGEKRPSNGERDTAAVARRSLFAAEEMDVGHVVARDDVVALRPGTGISPAELPRILGRRLGRAVKKGEMLAEHHFA